MTKKILLGAATLAASVAMPFSAFAATYAYVNTAGEVSTVTASDPMTAINTAANISMHSGVLLLNNSSDAVVGDNVSGI